MLVMKLTFRLGTLHSLLALKLPINAQKLKKFLGYLFVKPRDNVLSGIVIRD